MSYNNMQLLVQKACLFIRVGSLELNGSLFTFIFLKVVMFFFNNYIAQKALDHRARKTDQHNFGFTSIFSKTFQLAWPFTPYEMIILKYDGANQGES